MKILFLDIDGVLNVLSKGRDEFGSKFEDIFVLNLNWIIEATGAKIVLSSTWRSKGIEEIRLMWEVRDLPGEVIGITPIIVDEDIINLYACTNNSADRGYEIAQWLHENERVEQYCIIDDHDDMLPHQMNNFVRTSKNLDHIDSIQGYGLTEQCTKRAIEILNN